MPGSPPFDFFKTKEELNMKCKPGDLAIIIEPYHPENVGLIVHVIKTHWNQKALEKSEGDHLWLVECQQPMTYSYGEVLRRKKRGPAQDSVMQPIRGPQIERDITREAPELECLSTP
jgi:hypothetical protein